MLLIEHDLFGKPLHTFPDQALGYGSPNLRPRKVVPTIESVPRGTISRFRESAVRKKTARETRAAFRCTSVACAADYNNPAPRAHLYLAASTSTGISVEYA